MIVPAYNEEENIRKFVGSWYPVIQKLNQKQIMQDVKAASDRTADKSGSKRPEPAGLSRLVIIDDGSRDSTFEVLRQMEKTHPYLTALTKSNEGHGPTLLFGYRYALEHGADYVFQTDSDGQTNPHEFGRFWRLRHHYEAIFGNRRRRGDGFSRFLVEKVLCLILFLYFHVRVPDANAPFRLMDRSYLEHYLKKIPADYNLPNVMLVAYGAGDRRRIRFLPISFRNRQGGKNSINMKKIVRTGIQALKDFRQFRRTG